MNGRIFGGRSVKHNTTKIFDLNTALIVPIARFQPFQPFQLLSLRIKEPGQSSNEIWGICRSIGILVGAIAKGNEAVQ